MSTLESIEAIIDKIPCPICLNSRFEANLSCDLPNAPCDVHALCGHCGYRFVVTNDTRTMEVGTKHVGHAVTVHPSEVRAHEGVRSYPSVIVGHAYPLKHRLGRFQEGGVANPDCAVLRDMKLLKHAYSFCSLASLPRRV